jgi:hypothetical protein
MAGIEIDIGGIVQDVVDELKEQYFVGKWIPVSEELPEDDRRVLISLWSYHSSVDIGWYDYEDKCWSSEFVNAYDEGDVKAWMPLPEPYKSEKKEKGEKNEQS